tara:strand:- start:809 stop:2551 length:1743 start_codon:yes stop_codon:yes gene_type:complete
MEIFKSLDTQAAKDFEKLLNSKLSETKKLEEGKIYDAKVIKISNKFLTLSIPGLKQDPILDRSEIKSLNIEDKIKLSSTIKVLLEKLEDRNLDCVVSATKAAKYVSWKEIEKKYDNNEPIIVKLVSRCKGGLIASHVDTGMLCFMPGSQLSSSSRPIKDVSELFNEPMKVSIIKLDRVRGNVCISRRQIISANENADKAKIIESFSEGQIINATCKSFTNFGAFFSIEDSAIDTMVHLQEITYSRISSPDEVLEVNKSYKLKIIGIDKTKNQISSSIKALSPDPFDNMGEFVVGKDYPAVVKKVLEYGIFVEIKAGLSALCHQSELGYNPRKINPKTFAKINDTIMVRICEIDTVKRRISVSHRLTQENPWEKLKKEVKIGSIISNCEITGITEYAFFAKLGKYPIEAMVHAGDITFLGNAEEELKKFKKNEIIEKLKILEIDVENSKVRASLREAISEDPYKFYEKLSEGDVLTCRVVATDSKGITVKPDGCQIPTFIKKSQLASSPTDQRSGRWTLNDKIDVLLEKKDRRKVSLSIRALEEKLNAEALKKYGAEHSGRSLPFANLAELSKNQKDETEE